MLVIPEVPQNLRVSRRSDAVQTKIMKSKYSSAAGTAYVTYENCIVPKKCLGRSNVAWK